jgi:hypothetical protein
MPNDDAENSKKTDAAAKVKESGESKKPDQSEAIEETGDKVEYEVVQEEQPEEN